MLATQTPVAAQEIRAYVDADSITVGDQFGLVVVAPHAPDASIEFPSFSDEEIDKGVMIGDLQILGASPPGKILQGVGSSFPVADTITYLATTFAIDTAHVAPISVGIRTGGRSETAQSAPFVLTIQSVLTGDEQDVRDITPLASFPVFLLPWIAALAAAVAAFFLGRYLYRRRPQPVEEPPTPEPIVEPVFVSPIKEANARLAKLEDHPVGSYDEKKDFFVELSDIVRTYFSRRIDVPALETTSAELLRLLTDSRQNFSPELLGDLREILAVADLTKFAKHQPRGEQCLALLGETRVYLMRVEHSLTERARPSSQAVTPEPAIADGQPAGDDGS